MKFNYIYVYFLLSISLLFLFLIENKRRSKPLNPTLPPIIPNLPESTETACESYLGRFGLKRGWRNNNVGNIKIEAANDWLGKVPESNNTDGTFEQFICLAYGTRAMIKTLNTYYYKHNLKNLNGLIKRWSATDQEAYINYVSRKTGIGRNDFFDFNYANLSRIGIAISEMENGKNNGISLQQFNDGWKLI